MNTDHIANRTHQIYALGYYHGRTRGVSEVPPLRRSVELLEDFYRLGYAQGLKDQWAEQGLTGPL
jgi:hypothetical protein